MEPQIDDVKVKVDKALVVVTDLAVVTPEDYARAVEIGTRIKIVSKAVTERKEEITKPLNESLKSIRNLFKPVENTLEQAEKLLKDKMLVYKDQERKEKDKEIAEAQKRLAEQQKLDKENPLPGGEIPVEFSKAVEAVTKAEDTVIEKTTKTASGAKATEKFVTEYVVVDKAKIPLDFMEPNMVEIKKAFKNGTPVPGVEERKKAIISF